MATAAFTKKFTDHTNARGYQFEFHCDACGAGFQSRVISSSMSLEAGLLGAAESLLAGAGFKDTLLDRNREHAFSVAVTEMKPKFHQRPDGQWVCPTCRSAPPAP